MKDGEVERFDCDNCSVEFEVTLEPKTKEKDKGKSGDSVVEYCPFCGGFLTPDEDEDYG